MAVDRCLKTARNHNSDVFEQKDLDWCFYANQSLQSNELETEGWVHANRWVHGSGRVVEDQDTILELTGKIQELKNEMN